VKSCQGQVRSRLGQGQVKDQVRSVMINAMSSQVWSSQIKVTSDQMRSSESMSDQVSSGHGHLIVRSGQVRPSQDKIKSCHVR